MIVFFWAAFREAEAGAARRAEPRRDGILAVRDQILRPSLGQRGDSYLPFLVSLFFFIYLMNLMELIPVFQFPSMSRIGFVWPMVFIVYFLYLYLGFKHQGAWGYIKNMIPPGVPWPILRHPGPGRAAPVLRHPAVHARACGCSRTCSPGTCC